MIHFDVYAPEFSLKDQVAETVEQSYEELRRLLPELPEDLTIWLDNGSLIPETGDGGYAYAPDIMTLSFDPGFADKAAQRRSLGQTVFHEGFHIVQGFTQEGSRATRETALDSAIYEGCATVFEQRYAGSRRLWGDYAQHDEATLEKWREGLLAIPAAAYVANTDNVWQRWAFYDHETGERWRVYKVGTWLVERALQESGKDIIDLRTWTSADIRALLQQ